MSKSRSVEEQSALLGAFIGPKSAYYVATFYAQAREGRNVGWNWPAFFLGPIWFGYRKMYLWAAILIAVNFLSSVVSYLVATTEADIWLAAFGVGLMIVTGLFANALYRVHCFSQLSVLEDSATLSANRVVEIDRRGGVSVAAAIVFTLLLFAAYTPDVIRGLEEGLEETEAEEAASGVSPNELYS